MEYSGEERASMTLAGYKLLYVPLDIIIVVED